MEVIHITEYMNLETKLPPYLPFARFLLKADLSMTAKIVYSLLLDRMTLSQKNGWADEYGHSYIIYPVERIAEDIDRGQTSVKSALTELSTKGLIERRRTSFSAPNRIYVMLPDGRNLDFLTDGKETFIEPENRPAEERKSDGMTAGVPSPNHHRNNNPHGNQTNGTRPLAVFGRYENVLLGAEEYASLKTEYPGIDSLIEQLSAYMKSEGRTYADHAATLRLWMEREKGKTASKIPDYTHREGESL